MCSRVSLGIHVALKERGEVVIVLSSKWYKRSAQDDVDNHEGRQTRERIQASVGFSFLRSSAARYVVSFALILDSSMRLNGVDNERHR